VGALGASINSRTGMGRTITITSGKGGVGKTNVSLNLAIQLAAMGKLTCLFDADLGLANINILLGLQPERDLKDVILNGLSIPEVLIRNQMGVDILPGSSGVEALADLPPDKVERLIISFEDMSGYDFVLIDTSAGISKNVIGFCLASPEVVVVITPEPTSLTDAYALLKVLTLNGFKGSVRIIVNQCRDASHAKEVYNKFRAAVAKYLQVNLSPIGMIYQDPKVTDAVRRQTPLMTLYPECSAAKCIRKIAERLVANGTEDSMPSDSAAFWQRWLLLLGSPLKLPERKVKRQEPPAVESTPPTVGEAGPGSTAASVEPAPVVNEPVSIPVPPPSPPETTTVKADGTLPPWVEKLAQSMSVIADELRQFRQVVEGNGKPAQGNGQGAKAKSGSVPEPIALDLEAFLRDRNGAR
jgi:flagellar biosynthesis protein FlhG